MPQTNGGSVSLWKWLLPIIFIGSPLLVHGVYTVVVALTPVPVPQMPPMDSIERVWLRGQNAYRFPVDKENWRRIVSVLKQGRPIEKQHSKNPGNIINHLDFVLKDGNTVTIAITIFGGNPVQPEQWWFWIDKQGFGIEMALKEFLDDVVFAKPTEADG